jgi:hypothetical protein
MTSNSSALVLLNGRRIANTILDTNFDKLRTTLRPPISATPPPPRRSARFRRAP